MQVASVNYLLLTHQSVILEFFYSPVFCLWETKIVTCFKVIRHDILHTYYTVLPGFLYKFFVYLHFSAVNIQMALWRLFILMEFKRQDMQMEESEWRIKMEISSWIQ